MVDSQSKIFTSTESPEKSNEYSLPSIRDALAGASAGALAKTVVAPVERVKLLVQLGRSLPMEIPSEQSKKNRNIVVSINSARAWEITKIVYREEGLFAFWRGNTPNVIRQGGAAALNFMLMDWYKSIIVRVTKISNQLISHERSTEYEKRRSLLSSFLSGGLAGGTTTTFLYPIEFVRTRLAMDIGATSSSRMYPRGMRDVFCSVWNVDGFGGFYKGYGIALTGVVVYRALHLGGYDAGKTLLLEKKENTADGKTGLTLGERFMLAQTISIGAGTSCYPFDSLRRRMMMQAGRESNMQIYKNSLDAFRKILSQEGVHGLYLGLGPNLLRSFGGALLLVAYDVFKGKTF